MSLHPSFTIALLYLFLPRMSFKRPSCLFQVGGTMAKKLLWFKWVRGQSYSVYLIIYLPSYTQHLLSLEWFKHIITSCFSSFIMLVCYYNSGRNLSWPLQSISLYWTPMCLPCFFQVSRLSCRRLQELHWMLWDGQIRLSQHWKPSSDASLR